MSDITRKAIIVRLPEEFVTLVDIRAKERGISRNEWFMRMTKYGLFEKDKVQSPAEKTTAKRKFVVAPSR
jgi:metal-responsive CopG/Arc/MetJ family transcriptional regulator